MIYIKSLFACICFTSIVLAQIPNFGRCPEYDVMQDFDRESFFGKWYEIERYFAVSELASRCVSVTYERKADGNIYVNNEMTNRFTNVQRIVSGVVNPATKSDIGSFTVKYTGLPVSYDTTLHVLETDYDSYAVVWSCNPLAGPVGHTESVWILGRDRVPDGPVLQQAYGVLDKYKISRTFFVKTDQTDCEVEGEPDEAIDGPDSGYDIVVDDEDLVANQYGHDKPQIHQVQHIANVETLQQFSPAYPLQPIYRPVVYNHGSLSHFKENDAEALRTAPNVTKADKKEEKNPTNISENTKTDEKLVKPNTNIPLAISEKTIQAPKVEKPEKIISTEKAKSELVTEASSPKLPTPMDKVLATNAATVSNSTNEIIRT